MHRRGHSFEVPSTPVMARTVYVETTVPSAFVTIRDDPTSLHRRTATREWWKQQIGFYEIFISRAVVDELSRGDWPGKEEALKLVLATRALEIDDEVFAVARKYIEEHLVPSDVSGDALHLAVACVHEVDFLLTWNIRHLANPNKLNHLTVINRRLGLLTPQIVTPEMLWLE